LIIKSILVQTLRELNTVQAHAKSVKCQGVQKNGNAETSCDSRRCQNDTTFTHAKWSVDPN
jgi:hypothetical protein